MSSTEKDDEKTSADLPPFFDMRPFEGSVMFVDWMRLPWVNRLVYGVHGNIRMLSSVGAFGFTTQGGGHADWVLSVSGASRQIIVPGCKVQMVTIGVTDGNDEYVVVP